MEDTQTCTEINLRYEQVEEGQHFTIRHPITHRPVVYLQVNTDEHWRTRLSPSNKSLKKSRATRVHDQVFVALDLDTSVTIISQGEADHLVHSKLSRQ